MPSPISDPTAWQECWPLVTPYCEESIGAELGTRTLGLVSSASAVYPLTSRAIYVPFRLARPTSFSGMFTLNGATSADSIDMGPLAIKVSSRLHLQLR